MHSTWTGSILFEFLCESARVISNESQARPYAAYPMTSKRSIYYCCHPMWGESLARTPHLSQNMLWARSAENHTWQQQQCSACFAASLPVILGQDRVDAGFASAPALHADAAHPIDPATRVNEISFLTLTALSLCPVP